MSMRRKPSADIESAVDEFISNAKDQRMVVPEKLDLNTMLSSKPKTFPLSIPPALHKLATQKAAAQVPRVSLHDYILIALNEKIERDLADKQTY